MFIRKILLLSIIFILFSVQTAHAEDLTTRLLGRILLQVQEHGEAWYISPVSKTRIYLGRPADAFNIMREQGLGISEADFIYFNNTAPMRLSGRILLRVENFGQAYYVNPVDLKMHYLGRPQNAFEIMRDFGLGITNSDLKRIFVYGQDDIIDSINIIQKVPFTSQAPFGEWNDDRFQDGCEEASSLMAVKWARGEIIATRESARNEILAIAEFEKENYQIYEDTSVYDTLERLIKKYFQYDGAVEFRDFSLNDLKKKLEEGKIIIVPADGQKLNNPYFTPPGPEHHMLVIIGYDENTKEFITNDPGTRRGAGYRYNEDILFSAIRDYPTGKHLPIAKDEKAAIVVSHE
ncbi:MAG: C39 family peptidase [bacterium]